MSTGILLIRPHDQANALEQRLSSAGYQVFRHALIETQACTLSEEQASQLSNPYDAVVVISPAAVGFFDQQLKALEQSWPKARYYTVGSGTAERLIEAAGQAVTYPSPDHTGEALLALSELADIKQQHWLVITGKEGRELIPDTLRERGAQVTQLDVYQRRPLHPDISPQLPQWQAHVNMAIVTSVQQLELFFADLIDDSLEWARSLQWVVSSERLHDALQQQGVAKAQITIAANATTTAIYQAVDTFATELQTGAKSNIPSANTDSFDKESQTVTQQPAKAEYSSRTNRFAIAFSFLLLICVLILGAGNYWVWAQQQDYRSQTQAQIQELNERIENSTRAQEQLEGDLFRGLQSRLDERLSGLQQERQREAAAIREANAEERQALRDEFSQQRNELAQLQRELDTSALRMSQELHLVEARDLVIAAGRSLWLDLDKDTAIELLQRAESLLQQADQRQLIPIRQQLQADIDLLKDIEEPNLEDLAIRLSAMRRQLRDLPFTQTGPIHQQDSADSHEVSASFSDWRANLASAWDSFTDDFIRVQRAETMPEMSLSAEQRSLLLSQLELQLQLAQQALMQRQTVNYREALRQAEEWILAHFDSQSSAVERFAQELSRLSQQNLEPDYPTRLLSEAMLKDAVEEQLEGVQP